MVVDILLPSRCRRNIHTFTLKLFESLILKNLSDSALTFGDPFYEHVWPSCLLGKVTSRAMGHLAAWAALACGFDPKP